MKTSLTTLILVSLTTLTAVAATEENIHQTQSAKSGGTLVVDVDFGSIMVTPGDNDKVVIEGYRKIEASSKEKEQEYFAAAPVTVTTEGDRVVVRATRKHESLGSQIWNLLGHTKTSGRYNIRVPVSFNADLDTGGGEISARGLTGNVKADTSGGELTFDSVHGDVHAETSGGNIAESACQGKIDLETSGGRIETTGGGGTLRAETSGGAVTISHFAGDAKVESSGGKLRLVNIQGKLSAETSGGAIAAILPSPVKDDIRLETSAGAINVIVPPNAALTVDAETSAGHVQTDLPMTNAKQDHDSLKGDINGGGKALVLRSGGGSIGIVSGDKETAQQ